MRRFYFTESADSYAARIAIVRRPALENICNEYAIPLFTDSEQHFVEQLAGAAYERFSAPVLFGARGLANDHPVGSGIPHTKDRLSATLTQTTARARGDRRTQFVPSYNFV